MQFSSQPPHSQKEVAAQVERLTARVFFAAGSVASVGGALALALSSDGRPAGLRFGLVLLALLLAAVFGVCGARWRWLGMPVAASIAGWSSLFVLAGVCGALREPPHGFCIGFVAVVVCISTLAIGLRAGMALAAAAMVTTVALSWWGQAAAVGPEGWSSDDTAALLLRGVLQVAVFGAAAALGALIARINGLYMHAAAERERRFRGMLRIAADWYWEMDQHFRFTHLEEARPQASFTTFDQRVGLRPWDIPDFGIDASAMDSHRSDLEAHRPFRNVFVRRFDEKGRLRYARVSGQPRFDAAGLFCGYWGVGRDATVEVRAQMSVAASDSRYRELFNRTPSPLVLHRDGRFIDANPAGVALFGYVHLDEMQGRDVVSHFSGLANPELRRRHDAAFTTLRIGEGLPAEAMDLATLDHQVRHVTVARVKVENGDGPAELSILSDETDQRLADAALRRSESLLSSVVASSPDSITLSELESGRFVMVNDGFVRMFGFSREEAIGRSALELGALRRPQDHDRIVAAVISHGRLDQFPQTFVHRRGTPVQAMVSGATFEADGQRYLVLMSRDVTEAERTRLEHQAILKSASIGIAFTRDGRFLHANPHFERIFGWPEGALSGERDAVVWPTARDHEEIDRIAAPLLSEGQPVDLERQMRRLDGSLFWCRLLAMVVDKRSPSHGGTIWIAEDVTERRRVEQALAAARDAAEAASRAKSAFLANTSHEIRTPLNGLLGLTRLAMHESLDEGRRRQYLVQISESAQGLAGIMTDILDLSKIEAGKLTLDSVAFNLREVLTAVYRAYLSLAEHKGLVMMLDLAPGVPTTARGDPVRLRQIVTNYVNNAIKFTERGTVTLAARLLASGWLRIEVTDTGAGIGAQMLPRLFTPFTQGDESTTRRYGGTGLGLSICRELAQLMGGDVGVSSQPGAGSLFWVELPLAAVAGESPPAAPLSADDMHRLHGARVLVAEDNSVNMMIAVAMLEQWGIRTAQAVDGQEAVEAVLDANHEGRPFQAVLMDVQMPRMSGHEAARALRRHYDSRQLPIIALTAAALVSERDEAMSSGMNAFLTKPIDPARLREALAQAITPPPRYRN